MATPTLASQYGVKIGGTLQGNRVGIQAAMDSAAREYAARIATFGPIRTKPVEVWLPKGVGSSPIDVDEESTVGWAFKVPTGVVVASDPQENRPTIRLVQDMGGVGTLSLFRIGSTDYPVRNCGLKRLILDGSGVVNAPNNAQNHLVRINAQTTNGHVLYVDLEDLELNEAMTASIHMAGNAPYYSRYINMRRILSRNSRQNCITFQRGVRNVLIEDFTSINPTDQSIDFEISALSQWHVEDVLCRRFSMDKRPASTVTGLSIEGDLDGAGGAPTYVKRARFEDGDIYGRVRILRAQDITFDNVRIHEDGHSTSTAKVQIDRDNDGIVFNNCNVNRGVTDGNGLVFTIFQVSNEIPKNVEINDSVVTQNTSGNCVTLETAQGFTTRRTTYTYNFATANNAYAIWSRAVGFDTLDHRFEDCIFQSTAGALRAGIIFQPHTIGNVGRADIVNCTVINAQTDYRFGGAITDWLEYPYCSGALPSRIWDDVGVANPVPVIIAGDRNGVMTFVSETAPEGLIVAPVGSVCYQRDGAGVVTTTFYKSTGTGNTGWI